MCWSEDGRTMRLNTRWRTGAPTTNRVHNPAWRHYKSWLNPLGFLSQNNDEEIEIYRIAQVWLFQAARRWNGCKSQCLLWPIIEFEAGIVHSVSVNVWIFLSRVGTNKSYPNPEISLISLEKNNQLILSLYNISEPWSWKQNLIFIRIHLSKSGSLVWIMPEFMSEPNVSFYINVW
jgi:hypothetical protein